MLARLVGPERDVHERLWRRAGKSIADLVAFVQERSGLRNEIAVVDALSIQACAKQRLCFMYALALLLVGR